MRSLRRFEIHPGNHPGERRVYARLDTGELRRLTDRQAEATLLQYDIDQANKGRRMSIRSIARFTAICALAVAALVFFLVHIL